MEPSKIKKCAQITPSTNIVTGDSHLSALKAFRGINVIADKKCSLPCREEK